MISALAGIVLFLLRIVGWVLVLYCVMSFVMPQSDLFQKVFRYVEPILDPVRRFLWRLFPGLRNLPVDLSPMGLWLVIEAATALLNLLRRIL